jgi:hypothetical protein
MTTKKWILIAAATVAATTIVVAGILATTKTYRTIGGLAGVQQGEDPTTHLPQFDYVGLAGHDLVNLAMARAIGDTNFPNQVLAMTVACDRSAASLVVYDRNTDSNIATIADSTSMNSAIQQDSTTAPGPDRARFVARFAINENGDTANGLLEGFLTVAGRVNLDPATGCLKPILVTLDRDPHDRVFGDKEVSRKQDKDEVTILRAGLAHLIGVINLVSASNTNTVLVQFGGLSIHRDLPIAP